MLKHTHRFHGHGSLRFVFSKGKSKRSRHFLLRFTPHPHRKEPRVAIIVSKKVSKSAVKRNRIRRRLFEIVRHNMKLLPGGCDIVLSVFSIDVLVMAHTDLEREVVSLLRELTADTDNSGQR